MSKIPPIAWVCLTIVFLGMLGSIVYLSAADVDTAEFYRFLNVASNLFTLVASSTAVGLAGRAVVQTNGGLDKRIKEGAAAALTEHVENTGDIPRG